MAAAALALLGLLVFLFVKTDASRHRDEGAALALLRELKDVDTRWDVDAVRMTDALSGAAVAVPDRTPIIARILHELGQPGPSEALGARHEPIRAGVIEKQEAFRLLQQAHGETLKAIETAREGLASLVAEGPAAKARDPRAAEATATLAAHAERIHALLRTAAIESPEALERAVEAPLATLAPIARAADPRLAQAAARAETRHPRVPSRARRRGAGMAQVRLPYGGPAHGEGRAGALQVDRQLARGAQPLARLPGRLRRGAPHRPGIPRLPAGGRRRGAARGQPGPRAPGGGAHRRAHPRPAATQGVRGAAGADREDVLARAAGRGRGPRDQHAARLREEQRHQPARAHAAAARGGSRHGGAFSGC